jgi:hypothetical protein
MAKKDKLKGGLSDGMSPEDVAKKHKMSLKDIKSQLKKGIKVEMEHVNDEELAEEIALDHLFEVPDYYTRLEKNGKKAEKEMEGKGIKESKENITEFARRMRELAGLSEGNQHKSLKTIQEGTSAFEDGQTFYAKDMMNYDDKAEEVVSESEEKEDFETHKFEQKAVEEGENDQELYTLNENTIIVLDFLDEEDGE